eukprot:m.248596 g.248596  ORF g.248596 m.248596 type:complete len:1009 (-) comp17502_c0_seq26:61-3087(-)
MATDLKYRIKMVLSMWGLLLLVAWPSFAAPDVRNRFFQNNYAAIEPDAVEGAVMTSNLYVSSTPAERYTAVFGGVISLALSLCNRFKSRTNTVWLLKQSPPSTWHKCVNLPGSEPPSIRAYTMTTRVVADSRSFMIVFGGNNNRTTLNDLWELELLPNTTTSFIWPNCQWRQRSQQNIPTARYGGALTTGVSNEKPYLLLYGGCPGVFPGKSLCGASSPIKKLLVAEYVLDGDIQWSTLVQQGRTLPFATWPTMVPVAGSKLVVYGGYGPNATVGSRAQRSEHFGNQTFLGVWNSTHVQWTEQSEGPSTFGSSVLVPLNSHSLAVIGAPVSNSVELQVWSRDFTLSNTTSWVKLSRASERNSLPAMLGGGDVAASLLAAVVQDGELFVAGALIDSMASESTMLWQLNAAKAANKPLAQLQITWTSTIVNNRPGARAWCRMDLVPSKTVANNTLAVLTGGGGGTARSTTWLLDTQGDLNPTLTPLGYSQEDDITKRAAHASASLRDTTGGYLFIGGGLSDPSDWTHCPLVKLHKIEVDKLGANSRNTFFATLPYAARDATLTAYYDSSTNSSLLYYFGGLCGVTGYSTLYELNIHDKTPKFEAIANLSRTYARSEHAASLLLSKNLNQELVIIGGYNPNTDLDGKVGTDTDFAIKLQCLKNNPASATDCVRRLYVQLNGSTLERTSAACSAVIHSGDTETTQPHVIVLVGGRKTCNGELSNRALVYDHKTERASYLRHGSSDEAQVLAKGVGAAACVYVPSKKAVYIYGGELRDGYSDELQSVQLGCNLGFETVAGSPYDLSQGCQPCKHGFYSGSAADQGCQACPRGLSTLELQSYSQSQCIKCALQCKSGGSCEIKYSPSGPAGARCSCSFPYHGSRCQHNTLSVVLPAVLVPLIAIALLVVAIRYMWSKNKAISSQHVKLLNDAREELHELVQATHIERDDLKVIRVLAEGSLGTVSLAHWISRDREVAIKAVNMERLRLDSDEGIATLNDEINFLRSLRHRLVSC